MYAFLVLGPPLAFLLLALVAYPRDEGPTTRRAFARGLAASIPLWFAARILGAIVPEVFGSILLALHEWADRIVPYACFPALLYLVFYRYSERLPQGAAARRLAAFYAGSLCPIGLYEMILAWGRPDAYLLFDLPLILAAIMYAAPRMVLAIYGGYGPGLALAIAGAVGATLLASLGPVLLLARLWPIALFASAALAAGAWFLGLPAISRRAPRPLGE
jgi:hypothetical protein